jgi:low affinity Fe/Cu permease
MSVEDPGELSSALPSAENSGPPCPTGLQPTFSERLARSLTDFTGSTAAFIGAVVCILGWAAVGPLFSYSANWQLVINTGTTIVTFLMVFLIQRTQSKDALAVHLKLDELVAALRGASNRLVSAEDLSEDDLAVLRTQYRQLMRDAARDENPHCARSIDETPRTHESRRPSRARHRKRLPRQQRGRVSRDVKS